MNGRCVLGRRIWVFFLETRRTSSFAEMGCLLGTTWTHISQKAWVSGTGLHLYCRLRSPHGYRRAAKQLWKSLRERHRSRQIRECYEELEPKENAQYWKSVSGFHRRISTSAKGVGLLYSGTASCIHLSTELKAQPEWISCDMQQEASRLPICKEENKDQHVSMLLNKKWSPKGHGSVTRSGDRWP